MENSEKPEIRAIGVRFRMINNAFRRYVDHTSELKAELDNMTCSNGWIIGHLCKMEEQGRDVYQRDFENDFGITRSTASKVLKLLEKKGMIERVSVSHDGRMKKILLTEKSRELGRQMHEEFSRTEKQLTKGFSDEELKTLCGFLDRMMNNLELNDKNGRRDDIC
ncbi:MAG: MarR family transcriptional regulator [Oscillospiraceae bacterium]|nr:MarR family transcriptional regulator [Oscillospiraceae bacterium]